MNRSRHIQKPKITIVIITKNRPHDLNECLRSLCRQTEPPDELIIVDSSSDDNTKRLLHSYRNLFIKLRYMYEPRQGFPIARNVALDHASYRWIGFTDDDCIVAPGWIRAMRSAIRSHSQATAIAGLSKTYYPENALARAGECNEWYWKSCARDGTDIIDLETLDNKNIVYNKQYLTDHHIRYDENRREYSGASDDCDLGMQIWKSGGRAYYASSMVVFHKDPKNIILYLKGKSQRAHAHQTYELKWKADRPVIQKATTFHVSKSRYFIDYCRSHHLSVLKSVEILIYLLLSFVLIRWVKGRFMVPLVFSVILLISVIGVIHIIAGPSGSLGFRAGPQRTGVYVTNTNSDWWRIKLAGASVSSPVVTKDALYVGGTFPYYYAIDTKTGTTKWRFSAKDDVPFSASVTQTRVIVASVDGVVFSLDKDTGKEQWRFQTDKYYQIATSPLVVDNTVYFGNYDTYVYALDVRTGNIRWKYKTNGYMESSPLFMRNTVFLGNYDSHVYALSAATGRLLWKYKTGAAIIGGPAARNDVLYIGSRDGFMYALNGQSGRLLWKTDTKGPIDTTPAISGNRLFIGNKNNTFSALDTRTGQILWDKTIPGGTYSCPAVSDGIVYYGSTDQTLYAFDQQTGKEVWKFTTTGPISSSPSVAGDTIYFTSGDGYLYAINKKTGLPQSNQVGFTMGEYPKTIRAKDVLELSIYHDESIYQHPDLEASVSAVFTSDTNDSITVKGFYYDKNLWKIRFSPPHEGTWDWTISLRAAPGLLRSYLIWQQRGQVVAIANPSDHGFLRIHPTNPNRLIFDDGTPFFPLGIGSTVLDYNNNNYPLDDFVVDGTSLSIDDYASLYGQPGAGFNMFRWSINNASFALWHYDPFNNIDTILPKNGKWGDDLVIKLKEKGFRVWLTLFGFNPPLSKEKDIALLEHDVKTEKTISRYLDYIVARYGAYVDVWELSNEAVVSRPWVEYITGYLHSVDPYHHPIALSWEWQYPDIEAVSITAPHWYETESEYESDIRTIAQIESRRWEKPIIFGEQGNGTRNWDPSSALRMRIRMWTAFLYEAGMIFWNTSATKDYAHAENANIYIGSDERRSVRVIQDFIEGISPLIGKAPDETPDPEVTDTSGVRIYKRQSDALLYAYFHHYSSHTTQVQVPFVVALSKPTTLTWIDPATGTLLRRDNLSSGVSTIISPAFTVDVAVRAGE